MTGDINEYTRKVIEGVERLRAVMDGQFSYGGSMPNTRNTVPNRNSLLIDTRRVGDPNDPYTGQQWTQDQARMLGSRLNDMMVQPDPPGPAPAAGWTPREVRASDLFGASATNRGVQIFPFNPEGTSAQVRARVEKGLGSLLDSDQGASLFPGATVESARGNAIYGPALSERGPNGQLVPTPPGSGRVTTGLLEALAEMPDRAAQNLATDELTRRTFAGKHARDQGHPLTREDLQRTRQFFTEADWGRALQMIRKGATPTAALAALGYSAIGMAADGIEEQEQVMRALMQDAGVNP
jgi:hypothetical protein